MGFPKVGVEAEVKGYRKFMGQLGKMAKGVGSFAKGAAKVAIAGFGAIGVAAVTAGAALVKLASDATEFAGIKDAFAGIAESIGSSQEEMLAKLQKGSLGMVTQKDLMKTYNEAAQLVGVTFANQLPDAMGFLSKVAAATGQDMGFMLDSLTKGVGRLSPMILDNLGIQVTLADATANAAEQFGVEADQLTKTQIQAGMMNVTLAALKENTAAMPEVMGTAAQAQAAFGVALKDTKDQIGLALLPMFTKLMKVVNKLAGLILPKLVKFFTNTLVPAIQPLVNWFGMMFERITEFGWGLDHLFMTFEDGSNIVGDFFQLFGLGEEISYAIGDAVNAVVNVTRALIDNFGNLGDFPWEDILPESLADRAYEIAAVLDSLVVWWGENQDAIFAKAKQVWGAVETLVGLAVQGVQAVITSVMQAIRGDWEGAWDTIRDYFNGVWESIGPTVRAAWDELKNNIIPAALDAITGVITVAWEALRDDIAPPIWEGITDVVGKAWEHLKTEVIPDALDLIGLIIATAWENIRDHIAPEIWKAITTIVDQAWKNLTEVIIPAALKHIATRIYVAWTLLKIVVEGLWENIKTAVKATWDILVDVLIPGALVSIAFAITTAWVGLGVVVSGLWENIKEAVEAVWDMLVDVIIPGALEDAALIITQGFGNFLTIIGDLSQSFMDAGASIIENIKTGILNVWDDFAGWFGERIGGLLDWLPFSLAKKGPLRKLPEAGAAIIHNLMDGIRSATPALHSLMNEVAGKIREDLDPFFLIPQDIAKFVDRIGKIDPLNPPEGWTLRGFQDRFVPKAPPWWWQDWSEMSKEDPLAPIGPGRPPGFGIPGPPGGGGQLTGLPTSVPAGAAPAAAQGGKTVEINMGGVTISNGMDLAAFDAHVLRVVYEGLE